jgi:hypothetical protein
MTPFAIRASFYRFLSFNNANRAGFNNMWPISHELANALILVISQVYMSRVLFQNKLTGSNDN